LVVSCAINGGKKVNLLLLFFIPIRVWLDCQALILL
jgi:hypothetical protein